MMTLDKIRPIMFVEVYLKEIFKFFNQNKERMFVVFCALIAVRVFNSLQKPEYSAGDCLHESSRNWFYLIVSTDKKYVYRSCTQDEKRASDCLNKGPLKTIEYSFFDKDSNFSKIDCSEAK